ncbi:subtilin related serine protease [Clostridium sp. CAG:921]|nr:subtilin related serine protease [Clostridium sp. CAG:921]
MVNLNIKKITDKDVEDMMAGIEDNNLLRDGLCGYDLSNVDLSELSLGSFKRLSFDEKTIFSEEQLEQFHPFEQLELSKSPGESIKELHNMGIDGAGIKIAVIDSNIDINQELFSSSKIEFIETERSGKKEVHGATVLSALLGVVPNAEIRYYADNKYDKNRDKNILGYINDIIENSEIKIISMSSNIRDIEMKNKIYELLRHKGITLIDSNTFYKNFTYCFREFDECGNEKFEEAFCEAEEIDLEETQKAVKEKIKKYFDEYGINDENVELSLEKLRTKLLNEGKEDIVNGIDKFREYIVNDNVYGKDGINYKRKQNERKEEERERIRNNSVEIPCGGRTFVGKGGIYKYFATCSASYTIPQCAGLYALAKQVNGELSFENFINICKESSLKVDNRSIINPLQMIDLVQKQQNIETNNFFSQLKALVNESKIDISIETSKEDQRNRINEDYQL